MAINYAQKITNIYSVIQYLAKDKENLGIRSRAERIVKNKNILSIYSDLVKIRAEEDDSKNLENIVNQCTVKFNSELNSSMNDSLYFKLNEKIGGLKEYIKNNYLKKNIPQILNYKNMLSALSTHDTSILSKTFNSYKKSGLNSENALNYFTSFSKVLRVRPLTLPEYQSLKSVKDFFDNYSDKGNGSVTINDIKRLPEPCNTPVSEELTDDEMISMLENLKVPKERALNPQMKA